jgi:hypothetical protein
MYELDLWVRTGGWDDSTDVGSWVVFRGEEIRWGDGLWGVYVAWLCVCFFFLALMGN